VTNRSETAQDGLCALRDSGYMDQHQTDSSEDKILRITVVDVLDWVAAGLTSKEIASQFPKATEQEIERYITSLGFT
jgi:hypothetical protein